MNSLVNYKLWQLAVDIYSVLSAPRVLPIDVPL